MKMERISRLYEQGATLLCMGQYVSRWDGVLKQIWEGKNGKGRNSFNKVPPF